jgi:DNA primase
MPGVDFDQVRQRVSMAEVLRLLGFEPSSRRGGQLRGPCPVHGSTSAGSRSFSVSLELGRYQCFRCGSRGHALELWAAARGIGLYAATLELCERMGIKVPWKRRG